MRYGGLRPSQMFVCSLTQENCSVRGVYMNPDIILDIILKTDINLKDIKNLCQVNKHFYSIYTTNFDYIFWQLIKKYQIESGKGSLVRMNGKINDSSSDYEIVKEYFRYYDMTELDCSNENLTSLPLFPELTYLDCENTQLTSLPLLPKLKELRCSNNLFDNRYWGVKGFV